MKRLVVLVLVLALGLVSFAQNSFNSRLIPTPQHVVRGTGTCAPVANHKVINPTPKELKSLQKRFPGQAVVCIHLGQDSIKGAPNQPEAYRIVVSANEIHVYCQSDTALRWATKSLEMLNRVWPKGIPCMEIIDWPAFEYRGWLDDVSRGPIPHQHFVDQQKSLLEGVKMNFGSFYTEHTLYNPKYPDVSPYFGITPQKTNGESLEMMANLQCFAHFEKTLRIPFYQDMMDTKYNLNPASEASYTFLKDQIENTVKAYPHTRLFNINCDETESLGSGRARQYVEQMGASDAYCQHINRVYELIKPYNKEVLMWGDIVGKDPEMLKKLPKEMQYVVWTYVAQESYKDMLAPFKKIHEEQGNKFWVAPGVSHWSSIPQVRNYMQNIAYLARDGYQAGARGLINTAWDDSGESLFGDCWHAMYWAAEMAWNPIKSTDPEEAKRELAERERIFNENFNRIFAPGDMSGLEVDYAAMIYRVGDLAHNELVGDWFNTAALMQPLLNFYPSHVEESMLERCSKVEALVGKIASQNDSLALPHFTYACHRIMAVAEKSRLRVLLYRAYQSQNPADIAIANAEAQKYFKQIHELKKEYLRLWDEESEDYSREIICERYDRLGKEVQEAMQHVFINTTAGTDERPMVSLKTIGNQSNIYYTLDGRKPTKGSFLYQAPFALERSLTVKAVCYNPWGEPFESEQYLLLHKGMGHLKQLNSEYSTYKATYSGGGDNALVDGNLGSDGSYADGHWQGYWGKDIDVELDFGSVQAVNNISMRFLQNTFDWILAPKCIEIYTSKDGKSWQLARTENYDPEFHIGGNILHTDAAHNLGLKTRFLRVVAKNPGLLPSWHPAPNQPSYLFCDEIVIE